MEDGRLEESQSLGVSTTLSLESFTLSLRSFYHARITSMSPTLQLWMALLTFIAHTHSYTHMYTKNTNTLNTKQKLLLLSLSYHFSEHKCIQSQLIFQTMCTSSNNNHFLITVFTVSISHAFRIHSIVSSSPAKKGKWFLALTACRLLLKSFYA